VPAAEELVVAAVELDRLALNHVLDEELAVDARASAELGIVRSGALMFSLLISFAATPPAAVHLARELARCFMLSAVA